jgi:hypothetical protein
MGMREVCLGVLTTVPFVAIMGRVQPGILKPGRWQEKRKRQLSTVLSRSVFGTIVAQQFRAGVTNLSPLIVSG